MTKPARLITIPLSHYCEKARFGLDLAGVVYVEEGHIPLLHYSATLPAGGRSVPILVVSGQKSLYDSSDIVRYAAKVKPELDLYPDDNGETVMLERYFDQKLGPHTRRWAYHQLLSTVNKPITLSLLTSAYGAPVGATEARIGSVLYDHIVAGLRKALNITESSSQRSLDRCRTVFDEVSERVVQHGGTFMTSNPDGSHRTTPSAADISFAALASLILFPAQVPTMRRVNIESLLSSDAQKVIEELRATPAGKAVVEKIYPRFRVVI